MDITVIGSGSQKLKAELTEAAEFFAKQLMDPRMTRNIKLDIEVQTKLDVNGECCAEDDTKNPRWFTVTLKRNPKDEDIFQILAHEMVHVKQYAKNELGKELALCRGDSLKIVSRWQGKLWKAKKNEDAYFDSPWELEAFGKEVSLIHKWYSRYDTTKPWCVSE